MPTRPHLLTSAALGRLLEITVPSCSCSPVRRDGQPHPSGCSRPVFAELPWSKPGRPGIPVPPPRHFEVTPRPGSYRALPQQTPESDMGGGRCRQALIAARTGSSFPLPDRRERRTKLAQCAELGSPARGRSEPLRDADHLATQILPSSSPQSGRFQRPLFRCALATHKDRR